MISYIFIYYFLGNKMMMNAFKNVDIFGLPLILISNVKTWWKRGEGADR